MHDGTKELPPPVQIRISPNRKPNLKYFTLDGQWEFRDHFNALIPRVGKQADVLIGLMPNLGRPGTSARLHMHAVLTRFLYEALIWSEKMEGRIPHQIEPLQNSVEVGPTNRQILQDDVVRRVDSRRDPADLLAKNRTEESTAE